MRSVAGWTHTVRTGRQSRTKEEVVVVSNETGEIDPDALHDFFEEALHAQTDVAVVGDREDGADPDPDTLRDALDDHDADYRELSHDDASGPWFYCRERRFSVSLLTTVVSCGHGIHLKPTTQGWRVVFVPQPDVAGVVGDE